MTDAEALYRNTAAFVEASAAADVARLTQKIGREAMDKALVRMAHRKLLRAIETPRRVITSEEVSMMDCPFEAMADADL